MPLISGHGQLEDISFAVISPSYNLGYAPANYPTHMCQGYSGQSCLSSALESPDLMIYRPSPSGTSSNTWHSTTWYNLESCPCVLLLTR